MKIFSVAPDIKLIKGLHWTFTYNSENTLNIYQECKDHTEQIKKFTDHIEH